MTWHLPTESLKLCRKSLLEDLPTESLPVLLFLPLRLPEPLSWPLPGLLFLSSSSCPCSCSCPFLYPCQRP